MSKLCPNCGQLMEDHDSTCKFCGNLYTSETKEENSINDILEVEPVVQAEVPDLGVDINTPIEEPQVNVEVQATEPTIEEVPEVQAEVPDLGVDINTPVEEVQPEVQEVVPIEVDEAPTETPVEEPVVEVTTEPTEEETTAVQAEVHDLGVDINTPVEEVQTEVQEAVPTEVTEVATETPVEEPVVEVTTEPVVEEAPVVQAEVPDLGVDINTPVEEAQTEVQEAVPTEVAEVSTETPVEEPVAEVTTEPVVEEAPVVQAEVPDLGVDINIPVEEVQPEVQEMVPTEVAELPTETPVEEPVPEVTTEQTVEEAPVVQAEVPDLGVDINTPVEEVQPEVQEVVPTEVAEVPTETPVEEPVAEVTTEQTDNELPKEEGLASALDSIPIVQEVVSENNNNEIPDPIVEPTFTEVIPDKIEVDELPTAEEVTTEPIVEETPAVQAEVPDLGVDINTPVEEAQPEVQEVVPTEVSEVSTETPVEEAVPEVTTDSVPEVVTEQTVEEVVPTDEPTADGESGSTPISNIVLSAEGLEENKDITSVSIDEIPTTSVEEVTVEPVPEVVEVAPVVLPDTQIGEISSDALSSIYEDEQKKHDELVIAKEQQDALIAQRQKEAEENAKKFEVKPDLMAKAEVAIKPDGIPEIDHDKINKRKKRKKIRGVLFTFFIIIIFVGGIAGFGYWYLFNKEKEPSTPTTPITLYLKGYQNGDKDMILSAFVPCSRNSQDVKDTVNFLINDRKLNNKMSVTYEVTSTEVVNEVDREDNNTNYLGVQCGIDKIPEIQDYKHVYTNVTIDVDGSITTKRAEFWTVLIDGEWYMILIPETRT